MDPYTCAQVSHDLPRRLLSSLRMRDFAHQKRVSFSVFLGRRGFLQLATAKGPGRTLTQNTPKHVVPPKDVPFWGREHKIYHLDPHFPELVPFWGRFWAGLRKFFA